MRGARRAEGAYRLLLLAYPREFRRVYGAEAADVFSRLHAEAASGGAAAVLRLWRRTVPAVLFAGVRERAEARSAARRESAAAGGAGGGGGGRMGGIAGDARLAARSLARRPGFALTAVGLIGLGVGATTAVFSVVDAVLLRSLPYPGAERMVVLWKNESAVPIPDFVDLEGGVAAFEAIGAVLEESKDLTGRGEPVRLRVSQVTEQLLPMLGARAWRGRLFAADEFGPGGARVVVLTPGFWVRHFGGDGSAIGSTIVLSGEPHEVVGVLDPDFVQPEALRLAGTDVLTPLDLTRPDMQNRNMYVLTVAARLGPGATEASAGSELDALSARLAEVHPDGWRQRDGEPGRFELVTLEQATLGDVGRALWMFLGAVGLMLLIACANVGNLFLARATEREGEMAVRAALGASRGRLLAQVLTEGMLLGLAGGLVGMGLAALGVRAFRSLDPGGIPRVAEITVDARVLAFAVTLSALTGVLFGLLPAWISARADAAAALRESSRRSTASRAHSKLRNGLLVAELALALVLLSGAGVLFSGFVRLRSVDPGFDPERLVTVGLDVETAVPPGQRMAFVDGLLARIGRGQGVTAAGASWRLPFDRGRCCWRVPITHAAESGDTIAAHVHPVTAGYFDALGARFVEGRDFQKAERNVAQVPFRPALSLPGESSQHATASAPLPVVLARPMAERFFPGGGAVGRTLRYGHMDIHLRVVGVIDPIMHWGLDAGPGENVYIPFEAIAAWPLGLLDIAIRHGGPSAPAVAAARAAVRELAPDLPIDRITTMEERIAGSIATPRFYATLLSTFAVLAVILAAAGVYGSMLYVVGLRRREMGIRLALGARSRDVAGLVLRRGVGLVLAGTVLGVAAALATTRVLRSLVFEVSVTDPATLAAAAGALAAASLLACWLPARRAARVDPVSMLRAE